MKFFQRALTSLVPAHVADRVRHETDQWQLLCGGCGKTKSLWEAGGIRYGKSSTQSVSATFAWCRSCGGCEWRWWNVDRNPFWKREVEGPAKAGSRQGFLSPPLLRGR